MKNNFFNLNIFLDAVKRLKIIGILTMAIFMIEALIIPINSYLTYTQYKKNSSLGYYTKSVYDFFDIHPIIIILIFIITPIMMLFLFNFLNSRSACDYYHSVPQKRSCIYISMFLAIIFWIFIILVSSSGVALISAQFVKECYTLNMSSVLVSMLEVLAGSFFVASAISIAMCITGTLFNNIIVSLIIIFVPRGIITFITLVVTEIAPVISFYNLPPIFNYNYNIIFGIISNFLYIDDSSTLYQYTGSISTIALGIIYFIIAALLFKKRKSETAGHSAPNKCLQCAYRIIIALLICLIPIYLIISLLFDDMSYDSSTLFAIIILYITAIFAYFIYDIIATRKLNNLKNTIPGIGILAVCNIVLILIVYISINITLSYTPDADEINYIKITDFSNDIYSTDSYSSDDDNDYFVSQTQNVKLDYEELNALISEKLNDTCESIENDEYSIYNYDYYLQVVINSGGTDHYRTLYFTSSEIESIADILSDIPEYTETFMTIPSDDSILDIYLDDSDLSEEDLISLYDLYKDEIENLDFETWYSILTYPYSSDFDVLDTFEITSTIGNSTYTSSIPITTETETLANEYLEISYENIIDDILESISIISPDSDDNISDWDISIYSDNYYDGEISYDASKTYYYSDLYYDDETEDYSDLDITCSLSEDEQQDLYDILYESLQTIPVVSDNLVQICLYTYNNETGESEDQYFYINLSDENYEKLMSLNNNSY